ncbi:hypothetical protein LT85_2309 [Collimonas arenae]|uniref:Uncharacterized protein n=1 Tax=Collimonas arenae TaxID=279058 RepID=A0A0A1FF41_9BURK|nr:hypothetical protein LT85_2309 [Collimonas arenae]
MNSWRYEFCSASAKFDLQLINVPRALKTEPHDFSYQRISRIGAIQTPMNLMQLSNIF